MLGAEGERAPRLLGHRCLDDSWRMAKNGRAESEHEVHVAMAVDVPQIGALTSVEIQRMRASTGSHAGSHSSWNRVRRTLEELLRRRQVNLRHVASPTSVPG